VQCDLKASGIVNLGTVQPQTGIRAVGGWTQEAASENCFSITAT
jgi:hypothetical protein